MIPVDIEALIGKLVANLDLLNFSFFLFDSIYFKARACNGYLPGPDLGLNLDIAELVKAKSSK